MIRRLEVVLVAAVLGTLLCAGAAAQVLARPGHRTAIVSEPWWRSGVFYRIAPEHFQDSDGDGVGDLQGIAQRLDYLAALGVDAIVLQLPFDDRGFDDLLAEAAKRHIRLVIGLDRNRAVSGADSGRAGVLESETRHWMLRGAGGLLLPPAPGTSSPAQEDALVMALRADMAGYPGERVLITQSPGNIAGQLSLVPLPADAVTLTAALQINTPAGALPLLTLQKNTVAALGAERGAAVAATLLLTQRAAVLLDYGQELGVAAPERMPWTPTNVTPPPDSAKPAPPKTDQVVYGPYRAYVPPPPKPKPVPVSPNAVVLPEPDTLPGFSTAPAPTPTKNDSVAVRSAVLQERDPRSLLNLCRELIALHHGNAAMREGDAVLLTRSSGAAVWLRHAPAGSRTAATVIVGANASERPYSVSLDDILGQLHVHPGALRSLLPGHTPIEPMSTSHFALAPGDVFVGELGKR